MGMTDAIDLTKEQRKTLLVLLRRFIPGVAVWAYGSRVKWTARPNSDLDLVAFATSAQRPQVAELKDALAESNLPFPVDLHVWDEVPERFREIIRKEYVVVQEVKRPESETAKVGGWRSSNWGNEISLEYGKALRNYDVAHGKYRVFGSNGPVGWTDHPLAPAPGIILGRKGAYRGVQYSPDPFFVIDTAYYVVPKTELDMRWLYYAIKHYKLGEIDDGSPIPSTTRAAVYVQDIEVPPPDEQRAIAHILGTLDDKIELNRRMNETLEATARALFKSWFVDFDPVRAKSEGRDPGLPAHLADLFPDAFEDSELGETPKGWRLAPLPDVIDVNPTRALRKGVEAPYLDMANMPTRGHSPDEVVDRAFGSGMRFANGDTLVARNTPCLENGKTAFVDFLETGEVGWGSTEYIVLRPKPPLPDEFAYCLARAVEFRDFAIQSMTGSSGRQRVPAESLSHFRVVAAPKPVVELFGRFIKPLFARASAATKEGRTLAALRDALLPKLISGEVRIKGGAELLEEATE